MEYKINNSQHFYISKETIISSIIILLFSSIPWIDFIVVNMDEIEFVLNYNYLFFFIINFLCLFFIFTILKKKIKVKDIYLANIISICYWLIFQHEAINFFFKNNLGRFLHDFSSETSLALILILICFSIIFSKKKLANHFIVYFLSLNLFYVGFNFFNTFEFTSLVHEKKIIKKKSAEKNHNNIYFVILDSMMPIEDFEKFFTDSNDSLENFKNNFKKYNYNYYPNTSNHYAETRAALTALFNLDQKYSQNNSNINKDLHFPAILKPGSNPELIKQLEELNYEFKWFGNIMSDCVNINVGYCLKGVNKIYVDYYLLSAFLTKTPVKQIFNILLQIEFVKDNFNIFEKNNTFNAFKKFNKAESIEKKSTFYFFHHFHPHHPYIFDRNCNYKRAVSKTDIDEYKETFLCVTNQIIDFIKYLDKKDKDAIVVFQSDHNWYLAAHYNKYGDGKRIFSLIKNNTKCKDKVPKNPNNVNALNYILKCIKSDI